MRNKLALKVVTIGAIALTLAGCGTSQPGSVAAIRGVLGSSLPGTQGKTLADQDAIDDTVAGGCPTKVYTRAECQRHTAASKARRLELKGGI